MKKIVAISCLLCLCASLFAQSTGKKDKVQETTKDRKIQVLMLSLRKQVLDNLKDPQSTIFKDEFLSLSEDSNSPVQSLCGVLNSKNSFGGYAGFQRFISSTDGMVVMNTHDVPTATLYLWPIWCSKPL